MFKLLSMRIAYIFLEKVDLWFKVTHVRMLSCMEHLRLYAFRQGFLSWRLEVTYRTNSDIEIVHHQYYNGSLCSHDIVTVNVGLFAATRRVKALGNVLCTSSTGKSESLAQAAWHEWEWWDLSLASLKPPSITPWLAYYVIPRHGHRQRDVT